MKGFFKGLAIRCFGSIVAGSLFFYAFGKSNELLAIKDNGDKGG